WKHQRWLPVVRRVHHHRGRTEHAIDPRFVMLNVGDVLDGELVRVPAAAADEPEVGEEVAIPGRQQAAPAPEETFPGERNFHRYFEKFTFGTCCASAGASNSGYSL